MSVRRPITREQWSWAVYDAANSAYALCILAGFYPIFFSKFWTAGLAEDEAIFLQNLSVSAAGLTLALLAPFLGALAENWGGRKRLLAIVTVLGALAGSLLALPDEGDWPAAFAIYVVSTVCFYAAILFYDALLTTVATPVERHRLSGVGYACGYFGSVVLFLFCTFLVQQPQVFGLADESSGIRVAFILTGAWWMFFALPLFLIVKEPPRPRPPLTQAIAISLGSLKATALEIVRTPRVFWFLLAYWFYIDGVHTLITTATAFGEKLGLETGSLLAALIVVQVVGIFSAFFMGRAGDAFGPRKVIGAMLVVYLAVAWIASQLTPEPWDFLLFEMPPVYLMAALIGLAQGGVQVLSRSYYANIVPPDRAAAFFGFYNMLGRSAAILGPLVAGFVSRATGDIRNGIVSVGALFIIGLVLLIYTRRYDRTKGVLDATDPA
ncbi:MAG: MFS transporter [Opitutales bacterium]